MFRHNEIVLSGEVAGPAAIEEVRVELDGRVYQAARGLPRHGTGSAGFDLHVDTQGWEAGVRKVVVTVRDAAGAEAATEGEIEVRPYGPPEYSDEGHRAAIASGAVAMWCETPWLDGNAKVVAPFWVEGWAWRTGGLKDVAVYVNDDVRVQAQHGLGRPHLAGTLGQPVTASGGFAATIDPAECPPGWHRITVVATGADGAAVGMSGLVECRAEAEGPGPEADGHVITPTLLADRYVPEAHVGYSFEPEHHARYRWAALLAPGRRVLDAGSGTGFGTEMLARAGASRAEGFDVNLEVVEHARGRAGDVAQFSVGDLQQVPYGDDTFDLVTCFEAIEHVEDPFRALDELRRVLAPSGVLLVSTPNRGVYEEGNLHHLHELSAEEFETALLERFPHVRILRQQTHATSLLAGDDTVAIADSALPLTLDVRKVTGAAPGEELYTVAVASDQPLPVMPELAVLGSALDLAARGRELKAWKQRALLAESAAASERVRARDADAAHQRALRDQPPAAPAAHPKTATPRRSGLSGFALRRLQTLLRRR